MGVCCSSERRDLRLPDHLKIVPEGTQEEGWEIAKTEDVKEWEAHIKANLKVDSLVAFTGGMLQGKQHGGKTIFSEDPEQYLN